MDKSKTFLSFLMLCTSLSAFGQFHTITQQSKFYHIEQIPVQPDAERTSGVSESNSSALTRLSHKKTSDSEENSVNTPAQSSSDSLRQKYIDRYLSVSFPMKQLIVTSPFGQRKDPFTEKKKTHNGLDLRAACDEVYAMFDGTVKKTGEDKRSGKYITIQYGDFLVSYCHLSRIWVKHGIQVSPGEIIGITGNTGRSTGPHLHITCKKNNKYVDPAILIQFIKEVKESTLKYLCNTV